MKNFCTDIIETAKIRGIGRNGNGCRSRQGGTYTVSHSTSQITEEITISTKITYTDGTVEYEPLNERQLKRIFSYV